MVVICIASPWFLTIIIPLTIFYMLIQVCRPSKHAVVYIDVSSFVVLQRFYVGTSRQLKRLESSSRSPIYSHFQESISGASSIRAYSKVDQFQLQSENRVDYNQLSLYPSNCANRYSLV